MTLHTLMRRSVLVACSVMLPVVFNAASATETSVPATASAPASPQNFSSFDLVTPTAEALQRAQSSTSGVLQRAQSSVVDAIDQAMTLLGIPYRRGGANPAAGFDCSGFVNHVFHEGLGLILPRTSAELSQTGNTVEKSELRPGDLVFFNTMRRAFSHVGIYLGNGQFIHAPRAGARVRVEDLRASYWNQRYNGARRIETK